MIPHRQRWWVRVGLLLIGGIALLAAAAPVIAPNDPRQQFADRAFAPPMRVRLHHEGSLRAPFVYAQVLEDRLSRRYREDTSRPLPLQWFSNGRLVSLPGESGPLLLLGADPLGRDVWSRVLHGARLSLGVAIAGAVGALLLGALVGGLAGAIGGRVDAVLMLCADFLLVLPGAYLVLVLRGLLSPVLSTGTIFLIMTGLFAGAGWPHAARGVRAIVASERSREYATAALAAGANSWRLMRHLLPAAAGFLTVEIVLLVPALLVAETTVSYLNLGFPDAAASWGTMLQDAASETAMKEAPWMLAPAVAVFLVVLGLQLIGIARQAAAAELHAVARPAA
jgi:peptide/nickel transport system permease protein